MCDVTWVPDPKHQVVIWSWKRGQTMIVNRFSLVRMVVVVNQLKSLAKSKVWSGYSTTILPSRVRKMWSGYIFQGPGMLLREHVVIQWSPLLKISRNWQLAENLEM